MAAEGHEDQFRLPSLSGPLSVEEATFAGMGGKEEDAPIPAIRGALIEPSSILLRQPADLGGAAQGISIVALHDRDSDGRGQLASLDVTTLKTRRFDNRRGDCDRTSLRVAEELPTTPAGEGWIG